MNSSCLYIPRISFASKGIELAEKIVQHEFITAGIGNVSRVDFAPLGKKPGFLSNSHETRNELLMAFVYVSYYDTEIARNVLATIQQPSVAYRLMLSSANIYSYDKYWLLLPAITTIPRTVMNIHQVVENSSYLERLIMEQSATIAALTEKVGILEKQIVTACDIVHAFSGEEVQPFEPTKLRIIEDTITQEILCEEFEDQEKEEDQEEEDQEKEEQDNQQQLWKDFIQNVMSPLMKELSVQESDEEEPSIKQLANTVESKRVNFSRMVCDNC